MWRGLNFDVCLKYCSYRQNYFSLLTGEKLVDNSVPTIFSFTFEKKKRECTEKRNVIPIKQENCIYKPPEFYHLVLERSILKWVWDQPFVINHSEWFHSPERSLLLKSFFFIFSLHIRLMTCTVEYPCSKRRETRKKNSFKT